MEILEKSVKPTPVWRKIAYRTLLGATTIALGVSLATAPNGGRTETWVEADPVLTARAGWITAPFDAAERTVEALTERGCAGRKGKRICALRDRARTLKDQAGAGHRQIDGYASTHVRTMRRYDAHVVKVRSSYRKPGMYWNTKASPVRHGRDARGGFSWRRVRIIGNQRTALGSLAYASEYKVTWYWRNGEIFRINRDWDIDPYQSLFFQQDEGWRDNDSHWVVGSDHSIYRVDDQVKVDNCLFQFGCVAGSNYPLVLGSVWSGGAWSLKGHWFET